MLKVNALMIKSVDYAENDKILSLFSLEQGVISAKIRGVKKAGAKLKFAAEPFCFAEYVLTEGNLKSVTGASLNDSFYPLRENLFRYYAAGVAAEFVKKFCPENLPHAPLFLKTVRLLKELSYGAAPACGALLWYLLSALGEIGYSLTLGGCAACGEDLPRRVFFDFASGCAYCENCRREGDTEISAATYALLCAAKMQGEEPPSGEECAALGYAENVYLRALALLGRYLRTVAGGEVKSLKEFLRLYES